MTLKLTLETLPAFISIALAIFPNAASLRKALRGTCLFSDVLNNFGKLPVNYYLASYLIAVTNAECPAMNIEGDTNHKGEREGRDNKVLHVDGK